MRSRTPRGGFAGSRRQCQLVPHGGETELAMTNLSQDQQQLMRGVMQEFPSVFQSSPGRTTLTAHRVNSGDAAPFCQKLYRIPYSRREVVKELHAGGKRDSTLNEPVGITHCFSEQERWQCQIHRNVNAIARFEAFPIPRNIRGYQVCDDHFYF